MEELETYARSLGLFNCRYFPASLLETEERIRGFCRENKCGNYGRNYMCPPHAGSLEEIRRKFRAYQTGLLFQFTRRLDVKNDLKGLRQSKVDFHRSVLKLEGQLRNIGYPNPWGLIGGECSLCDACLQPLDLPCAYPTDARPSLESLGVDVLGLLARFGIDKAFHPDRITWTGCLLF